MWNLAPPPGFQGLHPDKPLTVYQRHMPHWRQDGATYFVTFRLADSLPQAKLNELAAFKADWQREHSARDAARGTALPSRRAGTHGQTARESRPTGGEMENSKEDSEQLAREVQERIERWLDQGMGECVLKHGRFASLLTSAMHHFDDERYELDCYVVMPNHAHAIVRPLDAELYSLEDIIGGWKKYSAMRINRELEHKGELWQEEAFDRIIRDEEHLWRAIRYIGGNPEKARLATGICPIWIRPQWVKLGWEFDGRGSE